MKKLLGLLGFLSLFQLAFANPGTIQILAAENFYGDVAKTIGGIYVTVNSVINDPKIDAQFFSPPDTLEAQVNSADLIIESGNGYDAWMNILYDKSNQKAVMMSVAQITRTGSNFAPHIWFNPQTMPAFAIALANQLSQIDPAHSSVYQANLNSFLQMGQLYQIQLNKVTAQVHGMGVYSTQPVCNALLSALNLNIEHRPLQLNIENDIPLTQAEQKLIENTITGHQINLFIYNASVPDSDLTTHFKQLAKQAGIPVIGVNEIMPPDMHYYQWMYQELFAIRDALTDGYNQ